jgi:hypothetical protein
VHINDSYFINFADAGAKIELPGDLVYRYGKRIGDEKMAALGAWSAKRKIEDDPAVVYPTLARRIPALVNLKELASADARQPFVRDAWMEGIQWMAARSRDGSAEGLFLGAKGGHNAESHNHNDVGNFIVYFDGRPALIDAGVATYTRKTFSEHRYELWTMQSGYHNLPTINGVMQKNGREFAARDVCYTSNTSSAGLSLDIAGAYPDSAGVRSWKRTVRLERGREVSLTDDYSLAKRHGELYLSLMTPCEAGLDNRGVIVLREKTGSQSPFTLRLVYPADKLSAETEKITTGDDKRLREYWGESLTRIILRAKQDAPLRDTWTLRVLPVQ